MRSGGTHPGLRVTTGVPSGRSNDDGVRLVPSSSTSMVQALMYGPMGAFISEMFATEVRYTGTSLA
ncbi:hypothetical protein [Arthrobacter sp.]|uniref:hypothetical protein n=1 Tax=Arthrobacter sp. TaxID=1667 RepID=UPI0033908E5F